METNYSTVASVSALIPVIAPRAMNRDDYNPFYNPKRGHYSMKLNNHEALDERQITNQIYMEKDAKPYLGQHLNLFV